MDSFLENVVKLKEVEGQLLAKRGELRQFEVEYREVIPLFPFFCCLSSSPLHFCIIVLKAVLAQAFCSLNEDAIVFLYYPCFLSASATQHCD
jgi:hypothetical protein